MTWHFRVGAEIRVDRLPGLFGNLEANRPASLVLPNRCPRSGIAMRGNIIDSEGNEIAAPQFAVDGEIEQREITDFPVQLQPGSD